MAYVPLGPDSALAIDNREAAFLLVSDERVAMIGSIGAGPCQHTDITSFATEGDTLFVLDRRLGRVVHYSISRGECTGEVNSPDLAGLTGMATAGGSWYFIDEGYAAPTDPEEPLAFAQHGGGDLVPLDLSKADLEADMLAMPVMMPGRFKQIRGRQGRIYFVLPYSHRLWNYNVRSDAVSFFELEHDSADISAYAEETDFAQVAEVLPAIEFHLNLFLLEDHVAIQSRVRNEWMLGVYTFVGDLVFRQELPRKIEFVRDGAFFGLESTMDEARPYRIEPVPVDLQR